MFAVFTLAILGQVRFTTALGQAVTIAAPEEEALNLVPYRLSPLDLPAGYRASPLAVSTITGNALNRTAADGTSTGLYEVRWQRGRLTFEILSRAPYGAEKLIDVLAIAGISAKKGVEATVSDPSAPSFAPVATEDERIDAALKLRTAEIAPDNAPEGFHFAFQSVTTTAGAVLPAADPAGTLRYYDRQLRRVIGVNEVFQTEQGSNGPFLELTTSLDGSPQAALADLARQHSSGSAGDGIDPPASVRDAIVAFRSTGTANDGSGVDRVSVFWTHGPVLIEIFLLAPSDLLTNDHVAAFTQQAEAAYQASALAGRQ